MTWHVYTFTDYTGAVIYTGFTTDPAGRLHEHALSQAWFNEVKGVFWARFDTERDARDAEYSIIAAERPKYNARGTDICPRCRTNLRGNGRKAVYCAPCQSAYQIERRQRLGSRPRAVGPTVTCPKCGGLKDPGPAYCRPCRKAVNAEAYKKRKAAKAALSIY